MVIEDHTSPLGYEECVGVLITLGGGEYREGRLGEFGYIDEEMEARQLGDEGTCMCVCVCVCVYVCVCVCGGGL